MNTQRNCFISYSWQNSADAIQRGTKEVPGGLGAVDPRRLKAELESRGLTCWLDIEQTGKVSVGHVEPIESVLSDCCFNK